MQVLKFENARDVEQNRLKGEQALNKTRSKVANWSIETEKREKERKTGGQNVR